MLKRQLNDHEYLQEIVPWSLNELFKGLLVVEFARRRLLLLILHDLVGESVTRAAEELSCSPFDIVSPIPVSRLLLVVLVWPWYGF